MNWIFNKICKKLIRLLNPNRLELHCARYRKRKKRLKQNEMDNNNNNDNNLLLFLCFWQREVEEERKHIMFVTQLYIRRRLCLIICCWPMLETIKQSNFFSCLNLSLDYKTQWRNELFTFVNLLSHVIEVGVLNVQHQTVRWQEHLVLWAGNLF